MNMGGPMNYDANGYNAMAQGNVILIKNNYKNLTKSMINI